MKKGNAPKLKSIDDLYKETEKLMEEEFKKLKGRALTEKEIDNIKGFSRILADSVLEEGE